MGARYERGEKQCAAIAVTALPDTYKVAGVGKPPLGDCMGSGSRGGGRKRPIGSDLPPPLLTLGGAGGA